MVYDSFVTCEFVTYTVRTSYAFVERGFATDTFRFLRVRNLCVFGPIRIKIVLKSTWMSKFKYLIYTIYMYALEKHIIRYIKYILRITDETAPDRYCSY